MKALSEDLFSYSLGTVMHGLILVVLVSVLYLDVMWTMVGTWWSDEAYSHGFLIPPMAAYLAWQRREEFGLAEKHPAFSGLWLTSLGCLIYLLGRLGSEFFLMRFSLIVILAGLVATYWGFGRLRLLLFPLILLVTMIPLPTLVYMKLAAPLQLFSSEVSAYLLQAIGVAVYQEGNVIHLAGKTLGVVEACSGLRGSVSLVVLALIIGAYTTNRLTHRIMLVALAVPIAVFANVIRIGGTGVAAEVNPVYADGFYHTFSGWLVFVIGFAALYGVSMVLNVILPPGPERNGR